MLGYCRKQLDMRLFQTPSSGVDVVDCGLTPTPVLLYTVKELGLNRAIMVTVAIHLQVLLVSFLGGSRAYI